MAAFTHFSRKLLLNSLKLDVRPQINNKCMICVRLLSYSPKEYDGNPDPGPIFMKNEVQHLLKTLTRIDLAKVFRKRKLGNKQLEQPTYKFMTDAQLEEALNEVKKKVDKIIQIPPVVSVRKPINRILSRDSALQGLDTSNFVFTDVTFGVHNSERIIVVRDTNGTLKEADWELRDRINQIYFPVKHRSIKIPKMFQESYFENVLNKREYVFILDRACLQFEPNDALYQKIISITYQHINDNNEFDVLRSTRHFGSFAFFLAWHKMIDNLLLDLIETEHIDEANALIELYSQIHKVKLQSDGNLRLLEEYIKNFSNKQGALELALQAYKNTVKQREELEAGIKKAHGHS
ncbi:28S ribosomal protein S22, mitochondrial [Asbolus verrucosus]|uniref:28S ribosomal protein S22, mitochondrial n=1 Tax=Asbolus verrucosus TaxID=1661398 RepID=A0A482V1R3_ASBVE|nr:28S ribosomal protein S22, mitochondrial [Asbolus verrucosus]